MDDIHDSLVLAIVSCRLSFNIVHREAFRRLLLKLQPRYTVPNTKQISQRLASLSDMVDVHLKGELKTAVAVSFTTDGWTQHNKHFLAISVHYITANAKLKDGLLPLVYVDTAHTGLTYVSHFKEKLASYINSSVTPAIGGLVTDNAANMNAFGELAGVRWISCACHTINLFLRDVIDLPEFNLAVDSIRKLVVTFRRSSKYMEELHKAQANSLQPQATLPLDVETRWNSLYLMCDAAFKNKDHIDQALEALQDEEKKPSGREWTAVSDLARVLETFHNATVRLSASRSVTISLVVPFVKTFKETLSTRSVPSKPDSAGIKTLKTKLLAVFDSRFNKYLDPKSIHCVATILDPETRLYCGASETAIFDTMEAMVIKLADRGSSTDATDQSDSTITAPVPGDFPSKRRKVIDVEFAGLAEAKLAKATASKMTIPEQVADYKKNSTRFPAITYWISRLSSWPELATFALAVLSLPASEVPCERGFSWAGSFFTDNRNRMYPSTLSNLMHVYANHPELRKERHDQDVDQEPV